MAIPEITFEPHGSKFDYFETVKLSEVYERASQLNFSAAKPHRLTFHTLIFITKGNGTHSIDFNHYPVQPGTVVFVNTGQMHALDYKNRPEGRLILFTKAFLDSVRANIRVPVLSASYSILSKSPVLNLNSDLSYSIASLLDEIDKVSGKDAYDAQLLQLLFSTLMLKLHQSGPQEQELPIGETQSKRFEKFLSLVDENFTRIRDSASYADMLGITYKSLNQLCKQATAETPKKIIDAHTILEAKRRLVISDTQITQLAFDLGFDEVSNFIKYFKKHTQLTPSQFKNTTQG